MSVLIKGMKMPTPGQTITIAENIDGAIFGRLENTDEWCPIVSAATEWILFKTRPMDEDERKEWSEKLGYNLEHEDAVIYTGQLPDDGQEVIVCSKYGHIWIDTFEIDPDYGVGFEENGDMDGLVAWMPKPKPYNGEGEEE